MPIKKILFNLVFKSPDFFGLKTTSGSLTTAKRFVLGDIKTDPVMLILSWRQLLKRSTIKKSNSKQHVRFCKRRKRSLCRAKLKYKLILVGSMDFYIRLGTVYLLGKTVSCSMSTLKCKTMHYSKYRSCIIKTIRTTTRHLGIPCLKH